MFVFIGGSCMPFLLDFAIYGALTLQMCFAGDGLEKTSIKEVQEGHCQRRLQRCPIG